MIASPNISEEALLYTYLASIQIRPLNNVTQTIDIQLPTTNNWRSFDNFRHMELDNNNLIYRFRNFDRIREYTNENECRHYIYEILDWVFNENIFEFGDEQLRRYKFIYQQNANDCDLLLSDRNNPRSRFIDIEIKKPNVINKSIMGNKELHDFVNARRNETPTHKVVNCVKQIYKYMRDHNLKYGILTTLNESWFFELTRTGERECLSISDTIDKTELLRAIYYLIKHEILQD